MWFCVGSVQKYQVSWRLLILDSSICSYSGRFWFITANKSSFIGCEPHVHCSSQESVSSWYKENVDVTSMQNGMAEIVIT